MWTTTFRCLKLDLFRRNQVRKHIHPPHSIISRFGLDSVEGHLSNFFGQLMAPSLGKSSYFINRAISAQLVANQPKSGFVEQHIGGGMNSATLNSNYHFFFRRASPFCLEQGVNNISDVRSTHNGPMESS